MGVKGDFIEFKSGRNTPYMINTGNFNTAQQLATLGEFYADSIVAQPGTSLDVLYGPAYKGIPLCITASVALHNKYQRDLAVCFNRKEKKDHGEGGVIIGYTPQDHDRIAIIEDAITAGTAVRESIKLLKNIADVNISNLFVAVDRLEKGQSNKSTIEELEDEYGIVTSAIVTIDDIVTYLYNREIDGKVVIDLAVKHKIEDYLNLYGAR
jgi:orotate phosphoribosyltransferase